MPWKFPDLFLDWEMSSNDRMGIGKVQHIGSGQALKLRDVQNLDILGFNELLLSSCHVPEVPHRHSVGLREICLHLAGQETKDLSLALKLGGKCRLCYLSILRCILVDVHWTLGILRKFKITIRICEA